jgi:hypothetical protein
MGFDFTNTKGESARFTGTGWTIILNLAEVYGWKPAGTRKPVRYGLFKKWAGNYDSNDGQFVRAGDALQLALALERALADPNLPAISDQLAQKTQAVIEQALGKKIPYRLSGEIELPVMREFIHFCKQGEFQIR